MINILLILLLIIISIVLFIYFNKNVIDDNDIAKLTDKWCDEVTVNHNPEAIHNLFCNDGNLIGTVSQIKRKGDDIRRYFDYFANKPGLQIISKSYNISKVTSNVFADSVFINSAFIEWMWDGLDKPIVARMTFVYKNKCIFQLHSSVLPGPNESLLQISDKF